MNNKNLNINMSLDDLLVSLQRAGLDHQQRFLALKTCAMGRENLKKLTLTLLSNAPRAGEDKDFWLTALDCSLLLRTATLEQA